MMQPNWFDQKYGTSLDAATAEQAMQMVASDPKIVKAVKDALATKDVNAKQAGPSRSQVIRKAIAETLQAV